MNALLAYLPEDRAHAIATGVALPNHVHGAALFADISGFTALTEALTLALGSRSGIEALTDQINAVYAALSATIARRRGSIISFGGDAITCWFDDMHGPAATRAAACGLDLQAAAAPFAEIRLPDGQTAAIAIKVAIASGPARRFVVGDPAIQQIDVLAGATLDRMSAGEHIARPGDVLLDDATAAALGAGATVGAPRTDPERGERFTPLHALDHTPAIEPWGLPQLPEADLRPWVLPIVWERHQAGSSAFLTELRPVVALFLRFGGLDFDVDDTARGRLDDLLCRAQAAIADMGGAVLQLTLGDKGAYLYAAFGAPVTHEDDAHRAARSAIALHAIGAEIGLPAFQIGISQGTMRCGAYGGPARKTYGVLGDDVNLAARLMSRAAAGETLLSGRVQRALGDSFSVDPRPPLALKGKAEPLPVFALTGARRQRLVRLQEPAYALPMVGRQAELARIEAGLESALTGRSQVIGIAGEAGMGKSRLVAEVIRLARRKGFAGYGSSCQSRGIHTPYLAWKPIWSAFFGLDPDLPLRRQVRLLEVELEDIAPQRVEALPLLGALLDLAIPDSHFTAALEPKERRSVLHALLEECLREAARERPLLIVIEDVHWLDAISHDLLEELARALTSSRVCFVVAYRPPDLVWLQAPRLEVLPSFTQITLGELSAAEAEQAIRAKLAQLYPARGGAVPATLVQHLVARAQGNPFYLEELLNYLHDRGLDPRDPAHLGQIELPDSLHTLILSRIDQLTEHQQMIIRVASIVGRVFRAAWLTGYYPALGEQPYVQQDLSALAALDITPLESAEPELAYLFKHIVTHEVTYESLPATTRARLHEQLARYLEHATADAPPLDALAFHYGRSENREKQRSYLRRAGEAAQKAYANDAALAYYNQLLPIVDTSSERAAVYMRRGALHEHVGRWDEADADYRAALDLSRLPEEIAGAQLALGKLGIVRSVYDEALTWLGQARAAYATLGDRRGLAEAYNAEGVVWFRQGEYGPARGLLEEGLAHGRAAGDRASVAASLNHLGTVALRQSDYGAARALIEESLAARRLLGDTQSIARCLSNLGLVAINQGDLERAWDLHQESLGLRRAIGDKEGISISLNNLGLVAVERGDSARARALLEESLSLSRELGDTHGIAGTLNNLGGLASDAGDYRAARALIEESLALRREIHDRFGMVSSLCSLAEINTMRGEYTLAQAHYAEGCALAVEIGDTEGVAYGLGGLAVLAMARGAPERAARLVAATHALIAAIGGTLNSPFRRWLDEAMAQARAALGEEGFLAAQEAGAKLSQAEALREAFVV